ncbi:hypothetical protein [Microterricola viridarii]|nr:hypothetical protein [Microterricola viridarii]
MAALIDYGRHWDIEVVEDRMIVVSNRFRRRSDRTETTSMILFAEVVGAELTHQAVTYSDPRAHRPRTDIAVPGQRLRRRSAAWVTVVMCAIVAALLTFPFVLGWALDL